MEQTPDTIFNFIMNSLKVAGAPYNSINNELIMTQCQVDVPASFFRPARTEVLKLQLVCNPDLLDKYPGSELVTPGSYRLQWFVDGIKQRGLICRGTVPYELDSRKVEREITNLLRQPPQFFFRKPVLSYQPNLLVNFKVTLETDEKFEELHSLNLNLVNGEISSNLFSLFASKKLSPHPPKKNLEKRRIPYTEAFQALQNHLKWLLENHDSAWLENAKQRWEEEVRYLESYYHEKDTETEDTQGFYRRVAEIYRKFRPVIRLQIMNVGIIYLPIIQYSLESLTSFQPIAPLIYDPVRKKVKENFLNPNLRNDTV